jgi:hypothetical protein
VQLVAEAAQLRRSGAQVGGHGLGQPQLQAEPGDPEPLADRHTEPGELVEHAVDVLGRMHVGAVADMYDGAVGVRESHISSRAG